MVIIQEQRTNIVVLAYNSKEIQTHQRTLNGFIKLELLDVRISVLNIKARFEKKNH